MALMWPPKDWRALIALLGSIAGAATLTMLIAWGVYLLMPAAHWWTGSTELHRAETIRWVLWIAAGTVSLVMLGLGFAINRRSMKLKLPGGSSLETEGGESESPAAPAAPPEVNFARYPEEPKS